MCPDLEQLADIAEAFAKLRFQDFSFFEMCSMQVQHMLREGVAGPSPVVLAKLSAAFRDLRIHDVPFFETVLQHVSEHWYDYPVASLAEIGSATVTELPSKLGPVRRTYQNMLVQLGE